MRPRRKVKPRWRPLTSNSSEGRKQLSYHFSKLNLVFSNGLYSVHKTIVIFFKSMSKYEIWWRKLKSIGRQFQSLSIVFVCAVNTKLASLFGLEFSIQIYIVVFQQMNLIIFHWIWRHFIVYNRQFQLLVYACRGWWEVRYHIADYPEKFQ
jgi:hypothetical protein